MNSNQLSVILKNDKHTKHVFKGVYPSDRIPMVDTFPCSYVINSEPHYQQGLHWLVMHFPSKDDNAEFFDSYGNAPDYYSRCFVDYFHENSFKYTYNTVCLQDNSSRVCGQYCVFYIYYRSRGYEMSEIVSMFHRDKHFNDWSVANFVERHFSML